MCLLAGGSCAGGRYVLQWAKFDPFQRLTNGSFAASTPREHANTCIGNVRPTASVSRIGDVRLCLGLLAGQAEARMLRNQ